MLNNWWGEGAIFVLGGGDSLMNKTDFHFIPQSIANSPLLRLPMTF